VGGGSLTDRIDGTPRPPRDAANLVESLAHAMAEAHRQGSSTATSSPATSCLRATASPRSPTLAWPSS
jgi:hypothetical protein